MLVHNDRIALGGVRGDKFIFGAIRGDKQLFDTSVITDANKEYILATYGEEALAKALVYLHGNPSFIPFFNEDPDTIISVCDIGWVRGSTDNCVTSIPMTKHTVVDCMFQDDDNSNVEGVFGTKNSTIDDHLHQNSNCDDKQDFIIRRGYLQNGLSCFYINDRELLSVQESVGGYNNTVYKIHCTFDKLYIENLDTGAKGSEELNMPSDFVFKKNGIGICQFNGTNYSGSIRILNYFIIYENNIKVAHYIPFKRGDECRFLNMLTYELKFATSFESAKNIIKKKIHE